MLLWKKVAFECATWCSTSATLDVKYVERRLEHEGLSFLTITLPTFGKDTEKCLERGYVGSDLYQGYTWSGGLPKFLSGFLCRVFDRTSGVLLDAPCIESIQAIRQLTLMFGKVNLPCTPEREAAAFAKYVQCEQDVRRFDAELSQSDLDEFARIGSLLFSSLFARMDFRVYNGDVVPKHGPGSTADGLTGNRKYRQTTWPARLDRMFPLGDFLLPNHRFCDEMDRVDILEPGAEIPAKVISVPKTLKTPRIIAMEPTAVQYVQQGILELFMDGLKRDDFLYSVIGIEDQTPNQRMALEGSLTGDLATLDLSEASDRVSNQHVRTLLRNHPWLARAVDACRSRKADVPGEGLLRLAKYASMGSALCFPFEAMVFTTVVFMGIQKSLNTSLSLRDIKSFQGSVRVYGDDILVPVDHVHEVIDMLQTFGFVVNTDKSFWNGKFRESCGREYYSGDDVSIVRVRELFPSSLQDATGVISIVSLRNQLYNAGYWQTCRWLDDYIKGVIRHFPTVEPSSPVLGRHSVLGFETQRLCEHLHIPLVKGYVVSAKSPRNSLDGTAALLKYFVKRGNMPTPDEDHLERSGRPHAVYTKLRWCPAY